jgi:expansin (peptidoglycan-binding protein)
MSGNRGGRDRARLGRMKHSCSLVLLVLLPTLALALSGCGDSSSSGESTGAGGSAPTTTTSSSATTGAGPALDPSCVDPIDHTGDGTFYAADGSGNCSFAPTGDLMMAAMNHVDYAGSAVCGACVHIQGPSGEVTVKIVDQCPECKQGDIDLSPEAFSLFADKSLGRVEINWKYVPCDVAGPLVYHFKEGSNQWWTAVQIRSSRYAVAKLEFKKDGQYVAVNRLEYNYFVADSGMGPGPYSFRVTDVKGQVLEDSGIPFVEAGDAPGAAQLPLCTK